MHPSYSHMGLILFTIGKGLPPSIVEGGGGGENKKIINFKRNDQIEKPVRRLVQIWSIAL